MSTETSDERSENPARADSVTAADADPNTVRVHFADGDEATYAFVVRERGADWLYAERFRERDSGETDTEVEALNAARVCRIAADRVHLVDDAVVHLGATLLVDPETLLADTWFDADAVLL